MPRLCDCCNIEIPEDGDAVCELRLPSSRHPERGPAYPTTPDMEAIHAKGGEPFPDGDSLWFCSECYEAPSTVMCGICGNLISPEVRGVFMPCHDETLTCVGTPADVKPTCNGSWTCLLCWAKAMRALDQTMQQIVTQHGAGERLFPESK